ncbi:hypothetical protein TraAM80_02752 [Trypanosoma rangeli]|uniref:Uncharacterized protein n=1 Tax=Trypanosoma rangeli TaxID=5698 RepID=A0A3R7KIV0_TRYRA|nr:uncharacterized protein TraAM80_02752 [Trypanosoma rangeli]RNF08449.1 hypothetical protein TraAM80_02752 [Trypanosoma rangeli]|eukprot:RNF08449.1 hypothetical protein TraAM80_02752 [Trypanosoma rangeli]
MPFFPATLKATMGRERAHRRDREARKGGVENTSAKPLVTESPSQLSHALPSFIEFKKQQASLLFIAWDNEDTGRIEARQLRPIIYALFPNDATEFVVSPCEIREAFAEAVGQPWSLQRSVTLGEVFAILDALWSSQKRRTRMVTACLRSVFNTVSDAQPTISREALLEFAKRVACTDVSAEVVRPILCAAAAADTNLSDTMDFEGFCGLILPGLVQG